MGKKLISPYVVIFVSPLFIVLTLLLSVMYGAKTIEWETVTASFFHFDAGNVDHQVVLNSRLPRAVGSILIGAFLAISGAIMQGMTRNFLASPSIMGVSDGAAFVITLMMILAPNSTSMGLIGSSFVGSALGVAIVFGLAWMIPGGLAPVRMAILGTIIGTFLSSLSAVLSIYFNVSQNVSFWFNARLHQMDPDMIQLAIPLALVAIVGAMLLAKPITLLSLGDDVATGLGQRALPVKLGGSAST